MCAIGELVQEGTFGRKFHDADGADGATEAKPKAANINPQQAAKDYPYGGFMGDDQHVAIAEAFGDFLNHGQRAMSDGDGGFATGGSVPGGISGPADVIIVKFLADIGDSFAFPRTVMDLFQVRAQFHFDAGGVADGLRGGDGAPQGTGV